MTFRVWGVGVVTLVGLVWVATQYAAPLVLVISAVQLWVLWAARTTPGAEGGWFAWLLGAEVLALLVSVLDLPDSSGIPWYSFQYLTVLAAVVGSSLLIWLWPRGRGVRPFMVAGIVLLATGSVFYLVRDNCDLSRHRSWCDATYAVEDTHRDSFTMPGRVFDESHLGVGETGPAVIRTFVEDVSGFPDTVAVPDGLSPWESTTLTRRETQHYEATTTDGCSVDLVVYETSGRSESEARLLVSCR